MPMASTGDSIAIDKMALVLSPEAYLIWVNIHHPHEPMREHLAEVFARVSPEERRVAAERAKSIGALCSMVEKAASTR